MGWFSQVTDFLSNPAFRIGAGVAGLASGAGAFDSLGDWGTALQGLSGVANVASGAASTFGPGRSDLDKATGALQLGLGGYNLGQTFGAVGNFGDVWNQLSDGGGGGSGVSANDPFRVSGGGAGGAGGTFGEGGGDFATGMAPTIAPAAGTGAIATSNPTGVTPGYRGVASDFPTGLGGGDLAQVPVRDPGVTADTPYTPYFDPPPAPAPTAAPGIQAGAQGGAAGAAGGAAAGSTALPVQGQPGQLGGGATLTPATPAPSIVPAGATPSPNMTARIINPGGVLASAGAAPLDRNWFDRAWTSLADAAATNPVGAAMSAVQVGGMLTQMFAASRGDVAQQVLDQLRANQPTPGAPPDGAEFRRLFTEAATRTINEQYETTRSGLQAKFASRGMLNSTVYTSALAALDKAKADNVANLGVSSYAAWNQALAEWNRTASVTNQTAAQQAANLTAVAGYVNQLVPQMDFSNMTRVLAGSPYAQQVAANQQRA